MNVLWCTKWDLMVVSERRERSIHHSLVPHSVSFSFSLLCKCGTKNEMDANPVLIFFFFYPAIHHITNNKIKINGRVEKENEEGQDYNFFYFLYSQETGRKEIIIAQFRELKENDKEIVCWAFNRMTAQICWQSVILALRANAQLQRNVQ